MLDVVRRMVLERGGCTHKDVRPFRVLQCSCQRGWWSVVACVLAVFVCACSSRYEEKADLLNEQAYDFHYRNLDSTLYYTDKVLEIAGSYDGAVAEACNNKAFVSIARMDYATAERQLDSIASITDNQVELLIADIQKMRLCQRQSRNKDFYTFRESALQKFKRIQEDEKALSEHHRRRMTYARTEFDIVTSTYYYYVGLEQPSVEAIDQIDPYGEILQDTPQLLNYLYNVGAGGTITEGTQEEINQMEMEYLFKCYNTALEYGYTFWIANSLQAMSEHLQVPELAERLIYDNNVAFRNINIDNVPDDMLAVNLAQRSLTVFSDYGDVYQTAGSYRTLAQCYRNIGDNEMALEYLNLALSNDSAIFQAPDLVASIWEQLSVIYAAINDKVNSHRYRNNYLDTQDQTRQDRYYESRADQLRQSIHQLNVMTYAIVAVIVAGVAMLFIFSYLRRKKYKSYSMDSLLEPLRKWKNDNEQRMSLLNEQYEETMEQLAVGKQHIEAGKLLNLEQRAKVSLVGMVTPYIDRILHEIQKLQAQGESETLRSERYAYVAELTDRIIDYNDILTQWIQLRKGELKLHIESFPIQALLDIVTHSRRGFQLKNITLEVVDSALWVKADKILTLFMINTIADNARKFTPEGGKVKVEAIEGDGFVEVSVTDNGKGMSQEQVAQAFSVERMVFADDAVGNTPTNASPLVAHREKGHGFGLVNCKGIIEKYKKISSLFKVCDIGVESKIGKGSRFYFRLPKGVTRTMVVLLMACLGGKTMAATSVELLEKASHYADNVWTCNTQDRFEEAAAYADSALTCINMAYKSIVPDGVDTLVMESSKSVLQSEILWYHDRIPVDFDVILHLRNEIAVAALSLHDWSLYNYNNKVYTQLYKEMSADSTLPEYCSGMQKSKSNKYMAVVILVILLLLIILAYFLLYYRHLVYYRFCLERVRAMNNVLESDVDNPSKLKEIERLAGNKVEGDKNFKNKKSIYANERLPEPLKNVADELIGTLKQSIDTHQRKKSEIELAEDEVRKCQMENDQLHVANSVLDNCLSTLKHETMYYPSRIRTLVDSRDQQLQSISELADYYKELYTLLSAQAMKQVESIKLECKPVRLKDVMTGNGNGDFGDITILGDYTMLKLLFSILKKQGGGGKPMFNVSHKDDRYVVVKVEFPQMALSEEECHELFNPGMSNIPFLLCRQIVRDVGEYTNARGCGIMAQPNGKGGTDIMVTLVKARKLTTY